MGLEDELEAIDRDGTNGLKCSVQQAMVDHPDWADLIFESCTNPSKPQAKVALVLRKYGIVMSDSTIGRHRRGDCRCRVQMPERYE